MIPASVDLHRCKSAGVKWQEIGKARLGIPGKTTCPYLFGKEMGCMPCC